MGTSKVNSIKNRLILFNSQALLYKLPVLRTFFIPVVRFPNVSYF